MKLTTDCGTISVNKRQKPDCFLTGVVLSENCPTDETTLKELLLSNNTLIKTCRGPAEALRLGMAVGNGYGKAFTMAESTKQETRSTTVMGEIYCRRMAERHRLNLNRRYCTGQPSDRKRRELMEFTAKRLGVMGKLDWKHLLADAMAQAFDKDEPCALRESLIYVGAVTVAWAEDIDNRLGALNRVRKTGTV